MKIKTLFYCTQCGNETPKWQGQCSACGAWNTIVEQPTQGKTKSRSAVSKSMVGSISLRKPKLVSEMEIDQEIRFTTGLAELDRVLGGGAVKGSLVLIGGAPGIGKSTLMLQICDQLCRTAKVLYVSGEESERQLKLRAERLGVGQMGLYLFAENNLDAVISAVEETQPDILIVDSIQTMYNGEQTSSPGSITQ
ncbi:MAG: AAA family ATPase, partial [Ruminiclostridium sp.]|nr:AAA family ATPase [Ruminiclostridium sp.]